MNITHRIALTLTCHLVVFAGCERKTVIVVEPATPDPVTQTKTLETAALKSAIDTYEQAPNDENAAEVRKALADLDGEIAELEGDVAKESGEDRAEAAQKLANLTAYRAAESARFAKAQTAPRQIKVDPRSGVQKAEDAVRRTGETLENVAEKAEDAIKDIAR